MFINYDWLNLEDTDEEDDVQVDEGQEYLQTTLHQAARDGNTRLIEEILQKRYLSRKEQKNAINRLDK